MRLSLIILSKKTRFGPSALNRIIKHVFVFDLRIWRILSLSSSLVDLLFLGQWREQRGTLSDDDMRVYPILGQALLYWENSVALLVLLPHILVLEIDMTLIHPWILVRRTALVPTFREIGSFRAFTDDEASNLIVGQLFSMLHDLDLVAAGVLFHVYFDERIDVLLVMLNWAAVVVIEVLDARIVCGRNHHRYSLRVNQRGNFVARWLWNWNSPAVIWSKLFSEHVGVTLGQYGSLVLIEAIFWQ